MKKQKNTGSNYLPYIVILFCFGMWQLASDLGWVPKYLLRSPIEVFEAFIKDFDLIFYHTQMTLLVSIIGTVLGIITGFILAVLMYQYTVVRKALYPLVIITQTIPTVAIAPLLVLWFGYGMIPKLILVIFYTFFIFAISLLEGFDSTDEDALNIMKSMNATHFQTFRHLLLPNSLPHFFTALKIAVSYSMIGAVVAEFVGGFRGLGVYMMRVKSAYAYDKMFAAILLISVISLILMKLVSFLQIKLTPWQNIKTREK